MRVLLLLPLVACSGTSTPVKTPPPTPVDVLADAASPTVRVAEPPAPTLRLPDTLTALGYWADLEIDPAQPGFHGELQLDGTLATAASLIWLNADRLTITQATAELENGDVIALEPVPLPEDFVGLRAPRDLPAGYVRLRLSYDGVFETHDSMGAFVQPVDGEPYVLTQLEALGARRVFPCLDEPSSKVPWNLTLAVPTELVALGNAPVLREETLSATTKRVVFAETPPLPTYLVAFAVGPFELVDAGETPGGAPIRVAAFKGMADLTGWSAESSAEVLRILEDWFGIPYPYAKLDLVPIPTTTWFGAMENAGMITFRADLLMHPEGQLTDADKMNFVWYLGHEAGHQWFGDLVTMAWWNDLWLNEAFATWIEEKVLATFRPGWVKPETWVQRRSDALGSDGLVSARMIHQPIDTRDDIQSAFDGITYGKGSTVIRMFEHWIGADTFQEGVRDYLTAHAHGNATSADFLAAIDAVTDLDVTTAFNTFLDQAGAPRVSAALSCPEGGAPTVTLRQDRWLPRGAPTPTGAAPRWQFPVCVDHGTGKARARTCTFLTEETATMTLEGGCPKWILPNADGTGYYRVALTADGLDALLDHGWKQLASHERLLVADDVGAMVARGDARYGLVLDLAERLVSAPSREARDFAGSTAWGATWLASDTAAAPKVARWIRATFGKQARALGWLTRKDDDLDDNAARGLLVPLVAERAGDTKLLDQAVAHARKWRDLPESDRAPILRAAVTRSAALRAELIAALTTKDARELRDVIAGLSAIDDPDAAAPVLAALLDPAVDLTQAYALLNGLAGSREVQPLVAKFLDEHFDELLLRLPEQIIAETIYVFTRSCDAADRAAAEAWAADRLAGAVGGPREIAQALEQLDQCVAQKAALGPELDAWLKQRKKK